MALQQESQTCRPDFETSRSEVAGEMWASAAASDSVRIRLLANIFIEPETLSEHDDRADTGG